MDQILTGELSGMDQAGVLRHSLVCNMQKL